MNFCKLEKLIRDDFIQARRDRSIIQSNILQVLITDIGNATIANERQPLKDLAIQEIVQRLAKKVTEAAEQYKSAGRTEQFNEESAQFKTLQAYLPTQLTSSQVEKIVNDTITQMNTSSLADMGKIIQTIINKYQNQINGKLVSQIVKEKLSTNVS